MNDRMEELNSLVEDWATAEGVYEDENGRYDIHEQFRATLIFVKQQENWLLAGLQLSAILGRP
jgi:hypothetical protein